MDIDGHRVDLGDLSGSVCLGAHQLSSDYGGILLYLAIGWTFAGVFTLLALIVPNVFSGFAVTDRPALTSFGTLTTAGTGNITPMHPNGAQPGQYLGDDRPALSRHPAGETSDARNRGRGVAKRISARQSPAPVAFPKRANMRRLQPMSLRAGTLATTAPRTVGTPSKRRTGGLSKRATRINSS